MARRPYIEGVTAPACLLNVDTPTGGDPSFRHARPFAGDYIFVACAHKLNPLTHTLNMEKPTVGDGWNAKIARTPRASATPQTATAGTTRAVDPSPIFPPSRLSATKYRWRRHTHTH